MTIRTNRKTLEATLRVLKSAVSSRPGIPALTGILVDLAGNSLKLTATDLEISIVAELEAVGDPCRALIPAKLLGDAVKAAAGDDVAITFGDAGPVGAGEVARIGGASVRLLPAEDFPNIVADLEPVGQIDAAELVTASAAVDPAASRDMARPVLTGVLLELDKRGAVALTATDSYRLHHAELGGYGDLRVIVPARVFKTLRAIIGKRGAGTVTVSRNEYHVAFTMPDGTRVIVREIEGEYPNYAGLMPERGAEGTSAITYDAAELAGALKAAAAFAGPVAPVIVDAFTDPGIWLSVDSPDVGQWAGELEAASIAGEDVTAAFTPAYLSGAVAAVGAGATWELRGDLKPTAFYSADGRTSALVMPVRLAERPPSDGTDDARRRRLERYAGVPGIGTDAPREPSAAEREAGETVAEPAEVDAIAEAEPEAEPNANDVVRCRRCGASGPSSPTDDRTLGAPCVDGLAHDLRPFVHACGFRTWDSTSIDCHAASCEVAEAEAEAAPAECEHGYGPAECHVDICPNVSPAAAEIADAFGVTTAPEVEPAIVAPEPAPEVEHVPEDGPPSSWMPAGPEYPPEAEAIAAEPEAAPAFVPGPGNPYRPSGVRITGAGAHHLEAEVDVGAARAALEAAVAIAERPAEVIAEPEAEPEAELEPSAGRAGWSTLADVGAIGTVRVQIVADGDGAPWVDARRFRGGGIRPTRRGFALRPADARELAGVLLEAAEAADALEGTPAE